MRSRFEPEVFKTLEAEENLLNLMCYAAYGIPRALLNMISALCIENADGTISVELSSKDVLKEVKNSYERTYRIYDSLKVKLPMFRNFIDTGSEVYEQFLKILKEFNRGAEVDRQSSVFAIKRPVSSELVNPVVS